jgi:20S proteasome subunit alpha 2
LCSFNEDIELEDAVHTAILTLKEGFEGALNEHSLEIGIVGGDFENNAEKATTFRKLTPAEIKDYLTNIV